MEALDLQLQQTGGEVFSRADESRAEPIRSPHAAQRRAGGCAVGTRRVATSEPNTLPPSRGGKLPTNPTTPCSECGITSLRINRYCTE